MGLSVAGKIYWVYALFQNSRKCFMGIKFDLFQLIQFICLGLLALPFIA